MNSKVYASYLNKFTIVLAILTCFSSYPYITGYMFGEKRIIFSTLCTFVLAYIVFSTYRVKYDKWMIVWFIYAASVLIYGVILTVLTQAFYELRNSIGLIFKMIFLFPTIYLIKNHYNYLLGIFFKINMIILILSIILFILIFANIDLPSIAFIKKDGRFHNFFWIGATNTIMYFGDIVVARIAGFADEPGALALMITYFLVINELTYKSSLIRRLLFISGVLTFSLAFFVTSVPILIYFIINKIVSIRKFIVTILLLFSLGAMINSFPIFGSTYIILNNFIYERFETNDDGNIKGDNRSMAIPQQLEAFKENPIFGVGVQPSMVEKYSLGLHPNFFSYLASYGIFGMVFFYFPFWALIKRFMNRKEIWLLFAIGFNFLQRPSIEDMFSMLCLSLIFYSFLYIPKNENKCNYSSV